MTQCTGVKAIRRAPLLEGWLAGPIQQVQAEQHWWLWRGACSWNCQAEQVAVGLLVLAASAADKVACACETQARRPPVQAAKTG